MTSEHSDRGSLFTPQTTNFEKKEKRFYPTVMSPLADIYTPLFSHYFTTQA